MQKFVKALFPAVSVLALAACGAAAEETTPATNQPANNEPAATAPADQTPTDAVDVSIALIAHSPESILDDGSFNQGAWQGIQAFANAHGLAASQTQFFQPHEGSDAARIDLIYEAIASGHNFIVLPGFHFVASSYEAQNLFPDTQFVVLDAVPAGGVINNNLVAIEYAEEEAGFLAGYAAVMEGYRHLGFMGGIAVPAVVRFGHGFIQGAEHAAESLGLAAGELIINYTYLGSFAPSPEVTTQAAAWYVSGVEVIFAAAGGAGGSVFAAAEGAGASAIGVDVNQSGDSDSVITSAMKGLAPSVYAMLTDFVAGNFRGGQHLIFDASIDGVALPMNDSRFTNFTQAQYDAIFAQLASGAVSVSNSLEMGDIQTTLVTVNEM